MIEDLGTHDIPDITASNYLAKSQKNNFFKKLLYGSEKHHGGLSRLLRKNTYIDKYGRLIEEMPERSNLDGETNLKRMIYENGSRSGKPMIEAVRNYESPVGISYEYHTLYPNEEAYASRDDLDKTVGKAGDTRMPNIENAARCLAITRTGSTLVSSLYDFGAKEDNVGTKFSSDLRFSETISENGEVISKGTSYYTRKLNGTDKKSTYRLERQESEFIEKRELIDGGTVVEERSTTKFFEHETENGMCTSKVRGGINISEPPISITREDRKVEVSTKAHVDKACESPSLFSGESVKTFDPSGKDIYISKATGACCIPLDGSKEINIDKIAEITNKLITGLKLGMARNLLWEMPRVVVGEPINDGVDPTIQIYRDTGDQEELAQKIIRCCCNNYDKKDVYVFSTMIPVEDGQETSVRAGYERMTKGNKIDLDM